MRFSRTTIIRTTILLLALVLGIGLASQAGSFLSVDEPQPADAIVALAGDTHDRPARALELLRQGVAPRVFLDVQARERVFNQHLVGLAQEYIDELGESARVAVCPVLGASTNAEAGDVSRCLQTLGPHRLLIVTSEFHTRRARIIFRRRLPQYEIHVAAARNPVQFGAKWWAHREWAKNTFDEWAKLVWFELVDRWRSSTQ